VPRGHEARVLSWATDAEIDAFWFVPPGGTECGEISGLFFGWELLLNVLSQLDCQCPLLKRFNRRPTVDDSYPTASLCRSPNLLGSL